MNVNYKYANPSACLFEGDQVRLGLSPDLLREERVSFLGKIKNPLIFRDAMLTLRQIVISDTRKKKKSYDDYFNWLNQELEHRIINHQEYLKGYKEELKEKMDDLREELGEVDEKLNEALKKSKQLNRQIEENAIWNKYNELEKKFWNYIRNKDHSLWLVLDPVITVHPDQVSFEAFSLDESTYGCLSVDNEAFEIIGTSKFGTTNIDFSLTLANEIERFRTYNEVELSINPKGLTVDSGIAPEYLEKKIDLPESWIKGFTQVSSAASIDGIEFEILPVDMYDICSFLRRNKAHKSPRAMKWILEPNKRIKIIFEPWNKEITLSAIYQGEKSRVERIWGKRRWLIVEKIIPITEKFIIKLLGFGMPQFIVADMGSIRMTIGLTSWSSNDWVKGTAFNILAGFIGQGLQEVREFLRSKRILSFIDLKKNFEQKSEKQLLAGIGNVLRRGEAYYDSIINAFRYRKLLNVPFKKDFYEASKLEQDVLNILNSAESNYKLQINKKREYIAEDFHEVKISRKVKKNRRRSRYPYYSRGPQYSTITKIKRTKLGIDQDGQISHLSCDCRDFQEGPRNISSPCSHILGLYIRTRRFMDLTLIPDKIYNIQLLKDMLKIE